MRVSCGIQSFHSAGVCVSMAHLVGMGEENGNGSSLESGVSGSSRTCSSCFSLPDWLVESESGELDELEDTLL